MRHRRLPALQAGRLHLPSVALMTRLAERDEKRFWSKVALPNEQGCMLWLKGLTDKGYARFSLAGKRVRAHRVSYELAYGPIPEGLVIDHVKERGCTNRHCAAPGHLEAVPPGENTARGNPGQHNARKTHCPQDHAYDEENTLVSRGSRRCRLCNRKEALARYHASTARPS